MKYDELCILLPCHSLEDFPTHHEGDDAAGLLACWTALWHPALIQSAGAGPNWHRADQPPENTSNRLILVPEVSQLELPTGFAQRARDEGGLLVRGGTDRGQILADSLEPLGVQVDQPEADLVADFLALGYTYLQIEILTRQMRYSSNLDEVHFQKQLVGAAEAAMSGDLAESRKLLGTCFDLLAEERDHYYSVEVFLIDLTLVAETTLGASLAETVSGAGPTNLVVAGTLLHQLAERSPATLDAIRAGLADGRMGLVGGEVHERRSALLSSESILRELRRARADYESLVGRRALVYGRSRFGLTPILAQVLEKFGISAALHTNFEEGRCPGGTQAKVRWEGLDGTAIDAIARAPLDAARPETFLALAPKLGESMDMDHVATVCLAHWPGRTSPWYEDLKRAGKYGSALGKMVTIDQYFRETDQPGSLDRFESDQYRTPYLTQAVIRREADPISTSMRYWHRLELAEAALRISLMAALVRGKTHTDDRGLLDAVDHSAEQPDHHGLDERIASTLSQSLDALADVLPRQGSTSAPGYLIANPTSLVRRVAVDTSDLPAAPAAEKPVYASGRDSKQVVVDVPPLGYVWVTAADRPPAKSSATILAEPGFVRNEYFEATINPTTGTMTSIHEYNARSNRLSQQLAFRLPAGSERNGEPNYSVMACDDMTVTVADDAMGELTTRGRLLDLDGRDLARFQQTYRVFRGSRILELEVELHPTEEPRADAWNSYYACRFAWNDESAQLYRGVNGQRQAANNRQLEAANYLEVVGTPKRTAILTGGIPFHRRVGHRMLDSLLIVRGERERRFRVGIGIDLRSPQTESLQFMLPSLAKHKIASPPTPASGWLMHIDARNVLATVCEPIDTEGELVGMRIRLLETAGRPATPTIRCFRPIRLAQSTDFSGQMLGDCPLEDEGFKVKMAAHQWIEIEAYWCPP